jgi:predicted porin
MALVTAYNQLSLIAGQNSLCAASIIFFNGANCVIGIIPLSTGGSLTMVANSATNAGTRSVRQDNTIKYTSPVMSGFQVGLAYNPKNDYTTAAGATAAAGNSGSTEYSLRYTQGPVDVMYANIGYDISTNGTTAAVAPYVNAYTAVVAALSGQKLTNTILAGNYAINGNLKAYMGLGSSQSSDGTAVNSSSANYGVSYKMGQTDLMIQQAKVTDKLAAGFSRKMTALGANYNLSKMTYVYYRYDNLNYDVNHAATAGSAEKRSAFGLAVKF